MAGERTVRVKFDGDATGLGKAASNARASMDDATGGLDKFGEGADAVDTRAMGFRDTLTGVQDTLKGTAMLAKGPSFEAFLTLGMGIGDLGSGIFNFVVPALKNLSVTMLKNTAHTIASTAATVAHGVATTTVSAATKVWTGIQWLLNAALLANPIVLIVAGILLLVGVIILIATKTTWFQTAWKVAWGAIKSAALAVWDWLQSLPEKIGSAFSRISDFVTAPFKAGFNAIARLWNNTVGKLRFTVPDWVPGIGGKGFSMPTLPTFHRGGMVPGPVGRPVPILALGGERVLTREQQRDVGGDVEVRVFIGDQELRGMVRTEVTRNSKGLKRRALAGAH